MSKNKRVQILLETEIQAIYSYPIFSDTDRTIYFSFTETEIKALNRLNTISHKIYFLLQVAYYKAKNIIFDICFEKSADDVNYILRNLFRNSSSAIHNLSLKIKKRINHFVREYDKKSDDYAKEELYKIKLTINQYQPELSKVINLFNTKDFDNLLFKKVKKKAFNIISREILIKMEQILANKQLDKREFIWNY